MDYKTMSDLQQFAVVVRHEIDYVRPAVLGDTILTTGWLQSVDRAASGAILNEARFQ